MTEQQAQRLAAAKEWVAFWWPSRHNTPTMRRILRRFLQNAKIVRWLAGGRYPSALHDEPSKPGALA